MNPLSMEPVTLYVVIMTVGFTVQQSLLACIQSGLERHYRAVGEEVERERLPAWARELPPGELEKMRAVAEGPRPSRTAPA